MAAHQDNKTGQFIKGQFRKNKILPGPTKDTRYVVLTRGQKALIDASSVEEVSKFCWAAQKSSSGRTRFYATTKLSGEGNKKLGMHQLLCSGSLVRHINGDSLDNRLENLQSGSNRQNQQETHKHLSGKLPGANYRKDRGTWKALYRQNRKLNHVGSYPTEVDAFVAYYKALQNAGLDTPTLCKKQLDKLSPEIIRDLGI